jgi:hypothetical protein
LAAGEGEVSFNARYLEGEARVPTLIEARVLVESFQTMVPKKLIENLDPWIASASVSLIASLRVASFRTSPPSEPPSPSLGRIARTKGRAPS